LKSKLPAPKSPSPTTTSTAFAKPTPALGSSSSAVQSGGSAAASRPSTNQTATAFSSPSLARSSSSTPAAKPTPMKKPMGSSKPGSLVSGFDLFDVVKGYLIDEGFAETEQAAIAIMANMSEEWKLEIISEMSPTMQKLTSRPSVNIGGGSSSGSRPLTTSSAAKKPTTQSNSGLTPMQRLQRPASGTIQ
jgi:hypothetical protein